jgi:hypothetical protein
MWSADLQWTDVMSSLCAALLCQGPQRHSKVLVMLEDDQRSLGALELVAAILYLPDADAV